MGPGGERPVGPAPEMGLGRLLRRLELDPNQRAKIRTILEGNRERAEAARKAVAEARKLLEQTVVAGANDVTVRDAAGKLCKVISDEAVAKAAAMASVRGELTAEQVTKLNGLLAERQKRMEELGKGKGWPGPGGKERFEGPRGPRGPQGPGGRRGAGPRGWDEDAPGPGGPRDW